MTLTGQEARILVRFHLPDHPQIELYEDLCKKYKELSQDQAEKHRDTITKVARIKSRESKLDEEFAERLAKKLEDEDSIDSELPRHKTPKH